MDLGATLCMRGKPKCETCPLAADCVAKRKNLTSVLPTPKPKKSVPTRNTAMLVLIRDNQILLELRPPSGIWGGLWSLPEAKADADLDALCRQRFGARLESATRMAPIRHGFTHFTLDIQPVLCRVGKSLSSLAEPAYRWFSPSDLEQAGLPAPVKRVLQTLAAARVPAIS